MNPVNGTARITAAAVAVSVTFSIIWGMATLGYPSSVLASTQHQLAAVASNCLPK